MNYDAIFAAHEATYLSGALEPLEKRIQILKHLRELLKAEENEIFAALWSDLHKCRQEVVLSELLPVYHEIDYFIKNSRRLFKPQRVWEPMMFWNAKSRLIKRPIGPVLIIAPFNYPLNLSLVPLVGALACGCPATLLMSPQTPAIKNVISGIMSELGHEIAYMEDDREQLFPRPYGCVFFTGSIAVGKIIQTHCAKYLSRCVLELGGYNPLFITKSANIEQTAQQICLGKFFNAGETCIAPNFILAERGCEGHIRAVVDLIEKQYTNQDYCCRVINPSKYNEQENIIANRKVIYAHTFSEVNPNFLASSELEKDMILGPTLLEVDSKDELLRSELFSNVLPVVYFEDIEEAVQYYRTSFYEQNLESRPLAAYLFTEDSALIKRFPQLITAGTISINQCFLFLISQLPFGGIGESGLGRYHGKHQLECFTHEQPVLSVRKEYMAGFGYALNSFVARTSSPPFPAIPAAMMHMVMTPLPNCAWIPWAVGVLVLAWALVMTALFARELSE